MNKKTRIYRGFSMVEMMLLLVIVSLMLASGVTVISKKHVKVPRLASHGAYICYINKDGDLHQEKYLGIGLENKIMDENTDQCVFTPPARAAYLHIQATGGGGGGGASGYKGGTLFTYQSKTEVISPFGWTDDILKLKGMTLNELQTYGGKVWAYADGTGDFGDGGAGGDVYYIKQDCANGACLAYREWEYTGTQEKKCVPHYANQTVTYKKKKYSYYCTEYCTGYYCDHCNSWRKDYSCTGYNCDYCYDHREESCSGPVCDRCTDWNNYDEDGHWDYHHSCKRGYNETNYCIDGWEYTDYCSSGYNDSTCYSTCTETYDIPVNATCSGRYADLTVDVENWFAENISSRPPYREELPDSPPTLEDGKDVEERKVMRDTGTAQTVCNYGSNQIYTGTGIFGSFMAGEIPGVTCDNSSLSAAFGEQMVSMGTNTTSVHSTKTGGVSEFYDVEAGGTEEKFPMFMLTEKKGLGAFGESCTNTYNGTCGDADSGNRHNYNPSFNNPATGDHYNNKKNLQNNCSISNSYTYDSTSSCSGKNIVSTESTWTESRSYIDYYTCDRKIPGSSGSECMYDYDDVYDPNETISCAYVPDVVKGGEAGKGKFCALNDITVTTGLNYKGESSIIAGIRGSDRLLTGAGYKTLYTKNQWLHQDAGYAENGTPSQGFAEIRITGGGGDSWCELHKEKVPGRGQGARRETTGSAIPVEGKDAPYAGGNEATVGSINGAGYSENAGKKCGDNHVGFCLKASGNSNAIRENGKYTYNYTWNTNYLQYGEGGDAGEYRVKIIRAFKDKDIEITLGRGGAAGSHPPDGSTDRTICNGQDGGDTIVGDILTAKGGKGGEGCIPTVTEQLPYWYEGGVFRAEQPGTNGKLASVTNYKSNILNLVLPVDNTVLGAWIAASGAGGNGGGSFNNCWASEWVRTFEGKPITERYGPLDANQLETQGCRQGTYWGHTPDPEAGTSGVVLIKW